jgi:hypothetical protein
MKFLKKFFHIKSDKRSTPPQVVKVTPPDLDFHDLKNNFKKRTWNFEYYQGKLASQNPRLLHWIGSIDYSGYTREGSLSYLIKHYIPGDENRILLRLEDWVPNIRKLAEYWIKQHFPTLTLLQLNENYQLILYLFRKETLQQHKLLEFMNQSLIEKLKGIDRTQFYQLHPRFRRYLYHLALPTHPILRQWILTDRDPFNRLELLSFYSLNELTPEELIQFHHDKAVLIRRNFLYRQINHQIRPPQEELIQFCFDKNIGLRELAKFYLLEYYHIDGYTLYKAQQDATFYYIADYAKKEDWNYFIEGVQSAQTDIKYLCLKAICKINPIYLSQLPIQELLTEKKKVRALVCAHLPSVLTVEQIIQLKDDFQNILPNGPRIFLHMLYRKSFWHFIDESLSLLIKGSSAQTFEFIRRKFYEKIYTYEPLSAVISKSLTEKIYVLEQSKDNEILNFIKRIQFFIQTT